MNVHRIETTIHENGTLTLDDLPFPAGVAVEVIILETPSWGGITDLQPLSGMLRRYDNPFDPVAQDDWDAAA